MKKIISLLAAASMSALALVSCIKEDVKTTGETFTVNFLAQTPETKTIFGTPEGTTVPTLWENGDNIAVICNLANDKKAAISTEDGKSASFSAEFTSIKEAESYTFYAVYPYVASPYKSGKVKVNIPAVQAPVDGNIAKDAMGLVAKSEAFTAKPTEPVNLTFKHVSAYGCITKLDGVPAEANITAVKITSDNNIVGTFLSDCVSTTLDEDAASKSLTINTTTHENIWFSVAPFEGGNVKFEVITEDGTYVVEKDFTGRKFEAGKIAKFGVTGFEKSGAADVVYTLVKSVDELVEGANVIIAAKDEDYAISTTQGATFRNAVNITRNAEGNIVNPSNEVEVLILGSGTKANTYSFYAAVSETKGYLYAAGRKKEQDGSNNPSSNENYLKTQEVLDDNASFTAVFDEEGAATLTASGTNLCNLLKFNTATNPKRFSCYSSGQSAIAIYIDPTSVLPALKAPEVIAIKNGTTIDVAWDDVENATEYVVSCTGQADQTVNQGVKTASFTNLPDGDYVVTVTAKADGFKSATGSAESIHIGLLARELAFETPSVTVAPGELFSNTLTGKKIDDVVYTITNKDGSAVDENAVTIDANEGSGLAGDVEGEYVITATAPATAEYAAGEASYTLTVKDTSTGGEPTEQTIFLETFGDNGTSNTAVTSYSKYSATQEMFTDPTSTVISHYSSECKVGKNSVNPSTGYDNASGNSAVWNTGTKNVNKTVNLFTVDNINISGSTDVKVSFGLFYADGAIGSTSNVKAYYSIDGGTEQEISFSQPSGTKSWGLCSGVVVGSGSSLKIRFEHIVSGGYTVRIDDIKVVGTK